MANASPSAASLSTDLYGMATLNACEAIRARLEPVAAALREASGAEPTFQQVCARGVCLDSRARGSGWPLHELPVPLPPPPGPAAAGCLLGLFPAHRPLGARLVNINSTRTRLPLLGEEGVCCAARFLSMLLLLPQPNRHKRAPK